MTVRGPSECATSSPNLKLGPSKTSRGFVTLAWRQNADVETRPNSKHASLDQVDCNIETRFSTVAEIQSLVT
jgi:hypothetical protein